MVGVVDSDQCTDYVSCYFSGRNSQGQAEVQATEEEISLFFVHGLASWEESSPHGGVLALEQLVESDRPLRARLKVDAEPTSHGVELAGRWLEIIR